MGKFLSVSVVVWIVVSLTSACLFADRAVNTNSNDSRIVTSDVTNPDYTHENESSKFVGDYTKGFVKEMPGKLGLSPLATTTQRNMFEFRLWVNVGMPGDETLFAIRSNAHDNRAMFYHFRRTTKKAIIFEKEATAGPKSDWNTLLSEISNRLATPKPPVLDPKFDLSRHEGVICLEVFEKVNISSFFMDTTHLLKMASDLLISARFCPVNLV